MEMTKTEAMRWIAEHGDDDDLEIEELEAAFRAIYGRQADGEDRENGLWSVLCADPDVTRWIDAHTCPTCGTLAPPVYDDLDDPAWDCATCMSADDDEEV